MKYLTLVILIFAGVSAFAQKLPNKQEASIWAPANVKIDGKINEWGGTYRAHNTATDLFYTLANDDKNLYLVFHCEDGNTIFYKILTGGITFVIKSGNTTQSLIYPYFSKNETPSFKRVSAREKYPPGLTFEHFQDSVNNANNTKLTVAVKEIAISGFAGLDSTISAYNETGIKAVGQFSGKGEFTCEITIPLKFIKMNTPGRLSYQVLVNGGRNKYTPPLRKLNQGTRADGSEMTRAELDEKEIEVSRMMATGYSTVDFSAEYILARKP